MFTFPTSPAIKINPLCYHVQILIINFSSSQAEVTPKKPRLLGSNVTGNLTTVFTCPKYYTTQDKIAQDARVQPMWQCSVQHLLIN